MRPAGERAMLRHLLAAGLVLMLGAVAAAQDREQDPRWGRDPRESADPRLGEDPRIGDDPRETPADPYTTLEGVDLFEALFDAGETGRLKIAMRENAWSLLPYIDGYCRRWLTMAEHLDDPAMITDAYLAQLQETADKGRQLAEMADASLGDTRFGAYVERVHSWSAEERAQFKEEQSLYDLAMKIYRSAQTPAETAAALTPLNQALHHARVLGDMWGEASAYMMIARVQAAQGHARECSRNVSHAIRVGRQIRDMDAVWEGLALSYEASVILQSWEPAREALKDQYLISLEVGDEETTEEVMLRLVEFDQFLQDHRGGTFRVETPDWPAEWGGDPRPEEDDR